MSGFLNGAYSDANDGLVAKHLAGTVKTCTRLRKWGGQPGEIISLMSSWPRCTPSAPTASATSTRSLISNGTRCRCVIRWSLDAVSIIWAVSLVLSRYCTTVTPIALAQRECMAFNSQSKKAHRPEWPHQRCQRCPVRPISLGSSLSPGRANSQQPFFSLLDYAITMSTRIRHTGEWPHTFSLQTLDAAQQRELQAK